VTYGVAVQVVVRSLVMLIPTEEGCNTDFHIIHLFILKNCITMVQVIRVFFYNFKSV
jgi:hypothetical protein